MPSCTDMGCWDEVSGQSKGRVDIGHPLGRRENGERIGKIRRGMNG